MSTQTDESQLDPDAPVAQPRRQAVQGPAPVDAVPTGGFSRLARVAFVVAAIALALSLFSEHSSILAPVFLTVNLIITGYPIFTWLVKHGVPRVIGALATGLTVLTVLVVGLGSIVWSVTAMVNALSEYNTEFTQLYQGAIALLGDLGFDQAMLLEQVRSINPSSILNVVGNVASAGSTLGATLLVILVTMVFMVFDLPSMQTRFRITDRLYPQFTASLDAFVLGIRRYWLVTTVFGVIVAATDWVVLVVLGIPLPLVWAVLSFVTNYIPNVGFVIGLVPPALLALFEKGPVTALIVVVAYSVLNFVIQSIIQPKFTGDAVGITPTLSFLSLLVWTAVFGALGALIALPFTLMIKAMLIDNDPKLRWVGALIAANPDTVLPEGAVPPGEGAPAPRTVVPEAEPESL